MIKSTIKLLLLLFISASTSAQSGWYLHGDTLYYNDGGGNTVQINKTGLTLSKSDSNVLYLTKYKTDSLLAVQTAALAGKQAAGTYATGTGSADGTNTGDNAVNTTYASDYRAANFTAGTHYLAPAGNGSALTGLTASQVGLANVTNTSDANKPVSTAQQTALDLKADKANAVFTGTFSVAAGSIASAALANGAVANLTGTNTGDQTAVTGNAGTATALQTARTINGTSFNGTANITVPSDITPSTTGNVLTSNGTLWTSAANNGGWTTLRVSGSAATNTGTGLADITGLVTGTLTNATKYEIEVVIDANVSAVATGITYGIATGGTGGASVVNVVVTGTTTTNAAGLYTLAAAAAATTAFVTTSGANGVITMKGFVTTRGSGTATISIQHAKPTSGTATAQIGSVLRYRLAQ